MESVKSKSVKVNENSWHKIACWVWFIAQICIVVAYLFGVFSGEDGMSVFSVLFSVLDVFSCRSFLWYQYLSVFANGVMYVIIGVKLVKELIGTIPVFKMKDVKNSLISGHTGFYNTVKLCIVYFLLASSLNQVVLTNFAVALWIMVGVVFVLGRVFEELAKAPNIAPIFLLKTVLYGAVKVTVLIGLCSLVANDVVQGGLNGLVAIGTSFNFSDGIYTVYNIYQFFVIHVLQAILICFFVGLLDITLYQDFDEGFYAWRNIFIISVIYVVFDLIFYIALFYVGGEADIIGMIGDYIQSSTAQTLPILALAGAGWIGCTFPYMRSYKTLKIKKKETDLEKIAVPESSADQTE